MNETSSRFFGYKASIGALLILFAHVGVLGTFPLFLPSIIQDTGLDTVAVSLCLTVSSIVAFLCSFFVGKLILSLTPRWLLLLGSLAIALRGIILAYAPSLVFFYIAAAVCGFSLGCATQICASVIVKSWFIEKQGTMTGLVLAGGSLGNAVYAVMSGLFIEEYGWRAANLILAAVTLAITIPMILLFIKTPESMGQKPLGWEKAAEIQAAATAKKSGAGGLEMSEARRTLSFWCIIAALVLLGISVSGFRSFVVLFWQAQGMSVALSANLVAAFMIAATVASFGAGKIADKFGVKTYSVVMHGAALAGILSAIFSIGNNNMVLVCGTVLFFGASIPVTSASTPILTAQVFGLRDFEKISGTMHAGM